MDIEKLDPLIKAIARRYSRSREDIEDYEQIGRMKALALMERGKFPLKYYEVSISREILNEINKHKAQKRRPKGGMTSLDSVIGDGEDGLTLHDVLGEEDQPSDLDLLDTFKGIIKNKYGYFYIKGHSGRGGGIKSEKNPRAIVRKIMRGAIEEVARIPRNDLHRKVDYALFRKLGLINLLWTFYGNSPFRAVMDVYKGEIVPWNFRRKHNSFWKGENGLKNVRSALEWFVQKKGIVYESDCARAGMESFEEEGLGSLVNNHFNGSPFLALKEIFPNLNPWEAHRIPKDWLESDANQKTLLTAFLMENRRPTIVDLSPEEVYDLGLRLFVTKDDMSFFGMRGLLAKYGNSPYRIFKHHFPSQILPWTLFGSKEAWKNSPEEKAAKAVRWLFEDYLRIP